ncbi:membrane protein [Microbacterium sp. ZKA21]|uniref:YihY/virulence factor BrkB family protein n=1 Tax=Microbacterium sp. ZKA21 TaxID=3381694 RepID=UPI003D24C2FB
MSARVQRDVSDSPPPWRLGRDAWTLASRRALRKFGTDWCPDAAASLTFYALLAAVPASIVLISVIGLLSRDGARLENLTRAVDAVLPEGAGSALRAPLAALADATATGWVLAAALLVTVWSAGRYVTSFSRAVNRIYGVEEGRPFWKSKPTHLLLTVVLIVLVATAVLISLTGERVSRGIGRIWGVGEAGLVVWSIVRWPLLVIVTVLLIAILYCFAPNVAPRSFRWMSLGAAAALLVFGIASAGFGFYVTVVADYDRLYGPFASILIFLLWLWIANLALLLGVEIDVELERVRQLSAGIPAERQVQVELRDASAIAAAVRRDAEEERRAARVRREATIPKDDHARDR